MNMPTPIKLMLMGLLISGCTDSDKLQQSTQTLSSDAELSQNSSGSADDSLSLDSVSEEGESSSEDTSLSAKSGTMQGSATQSDDLSNQSGASDKPQPKPIQGLCGADQTTYFSCQVGAKLASVCSSGQSQLSYRFGTPAKTELEITSPVNYSRTSYSGGGEGRLRFGRGEYDYVVHSGIYAGEVQPDGSRGKVERAGVYVIQDGKQIADLACDPYPESDLNSETLPEHKVEEFVYYD